MSSEKLHGLVGREARPLAEGLAQAYADFLEQQPEGPTPP